MHPRLKLSLAVVCGGAVVIGLPILVYGWGLGAFVASTWVAGIAFNLFRKW